MGRLPEREYTDAELDQMHKATCVGCVSCLRELLARLLPFAWSTPHDVACTVDAGQNNCSCGKNSVVADARNLVEPIILRGTKEGK